jgi:hypothetical protein
MVERLRVSGVYFPNAPRSMKYQILFVDEPQTAAEIIRLMKRLGWEPQLGRRDVDRAIGSATHSLVVIAARARRLANANPTAAEELAKMAAQASETAAMLTQLRRQMHDFPTTAPAPTRGTRE